MKERRLTRLSDSGGGAIPVGRASVSELFIESPGDDMFELKREFVFVFIFYIIDG